MMNVSKQRGVSLSGLIIVLVILISVALLGFKLVPPYLEYNNIKRDLKAIASAPENANAPRGQIEAAWSRYSLIDNIQNFTGQDIVMSKEGGVLVLSGSYSVKVPLVANVSVVLDFNPTTEGK
jgi:Zn-dependent membrane protease YugP